MNSRRKGKAGELEAAKAVCNALGIKEMRRSQQFCGKAGDADIVGLDGVHMEVKRYKRISSIDFLRQAESDCLKGDVPIVLMRENGDKQWVVQVRLDYLSDLILALNSIGDSIANRGDVDPQDSPR